MNFLLLFGVFVLGFWMPYIQSQLFGNSGSSNLLTTLTCITNAARNCSSTTRVCGRYGSSNLCKNFANRCSLRLSNCGQSTSYRAVASTFCTGIGSNRRRRCNGLSSTSSSGGILSNILNLGASSSSSSSVRPIVINVGG